MNSFRSADAKTDLNEITPELMAKYLEEEVLAADRLTLKSTTQPHCSTCRCQEAASSAATPAFHQPAYSIGTQTAVPGDAYNSLCLRCNSNLNSPSRSSPYIMKLGGSSAEETAEAEPRRNEELQVNPILGHHRLNAIDHRNSSLATNGGAGGRDISSDTTTSQIIGGPLLAKNKTNSDTKKDATQSTISGAVLPEVVNTSSFNNVLIKNIKVRKCSVVEYLIALIVDTSTYPCR